MPTDSAPAKLASRFGWFPCHRRDIAIIREHGQADGVSCAALIATWIAFMELREEHRADTFSVSIGIIAFRAGVTRRHVFACVAKLETMGLLSHVQNENPDGGKKMFLPSTWTVNPSSPLPLRAQRASATASPPPVKPVHQPSEMEEAVPLHIGIKSFSRREKAEKKIRKRTTRLAEDSCVEAVTPPSADSPSASAKESPPERGSLPDFCYPNP